MNDMDLQPNKSSSYSKRLDQKSVLVFRSILEDVRVDDSTLEEGGTEANTDGYISILDNEDTIVAKIYVQIKHYNNAISTKSICYDIPASLLAYAYRMKGEIVIFITCDTNARIAYWKYIDRVFVESQRYKSEEKQQTYRYHFKKNETLTAANINSIIDSWEKLYHERMLSLKDEKEELYDFLDINLKSFGRVSTIFHGLKDSHIARKQTDQLFDWVQSDLKSKDSHVKLLVGNAGVGKTVIIKDLLEKLRKEGIKCLTIKADSYNITENETYNLSLSRLDSSLNLLASEQNRVVFIIDQIDALSQYLANDRNKLNNFLNIIAAWEKGYNKKVRIIVSCRKYDLEYDPSLHQLKEYGTPIEVNCLDEEDVKTIVTQLDINLYSKLTSLTINILRTPQYLDIFCRLYDSSSEKRYNYQNYMELYDDLWSSLLNYASGHPSCRNMEEVLFEIAKSVQEAETLNPTWLVTSKNNKVTGYLASECIVKYDKKRISFFHQSFYDYVFARYYVSNKKSFITELENQFQGLETRSSVKIFLDFERTHSENLYKEDINTIIFSNNIRLHLKQLAISIISSSETIYKFEYNIIEILSKYNHQLFLYFLSSTINPLWFSTINKLVQPLVPDITSQNDYIGSLRVFFSNYVLQFPDEIYDMINSIKEHSTKEEITIWILLYYHNDYANKNVRASYTSLKGKSNIDLVNCVKDAIDTNLDFALKETKELLINFFLDDKRGKQHDNYELFEQICDRLYKEYPKEFLLIAYDCFIQIITKKRLQSYQWYSTNAVFRNYMSDDAEKFFEWLRELMIKFIVYKDLDKSVIEKLLSLKDEYAIILSFQVIATRPQMFDTYIKNIVLHNEELDKFMESFDIRYHFLEVLTKWYLSATYKEQIWYQNRILTYKSESDNIRCNNREKGELMLPNLEKHKWQLICCTITDFTLTQEAKKHKLELCRRYKETFINLKPDYHVTAASFCGGVTSQKDYNHFSQKNWLLSFEKLNSNRYFLKNHYRPISLHEHAKAFTKCVENSPEKYKNFVFSLYSNPRIKPMYIEAGLLGLFLGGIDKNELYPLFLRYINVNYIKNNAYTFEQFALYYTKEDNKAIDHLIPILVQAIKQPLELKDQQDGSQHQTLSKRVEQKLGIAINSFQGHALNILISLCGLSSRRIQIYELLNLLCIDLAIELRLEVLYYIYNKEYYDEVLLDKLLPIYLSGCGAYGLMVRTDAVQYYYYFKADIILSYINKLMNDQRSHEILAQIFFYGLDHDDIKNQCKQNLEKILSWNDKNVIAAIVKVSFKNISEPNFDAMSKKIILKYMKDDREEIMKSYEYHISYLPVESFELFRMITLNWKQKTHKDYISLIKYLNKCAGLRPRDCYQYIKECDILHSSNYFVKEKIMTFLLGIYKKMKETENLDAMNELMDIFDDYTITNSFIINDALEKIGV